MFRERRSLPYAFWVGVSLVASGAVLAQAAAVGTEFQVNTYTATDQDFPAVATDRDGDFVVVWASVGSSGPDPFYSIQAQRYDALGNALGAQFQVNEYTFNYQRSSAVASDTDGDFVVVWSSYGSSGSDTSGYSIQGQRYDALGNALGVQFQVNTYTTSYQTIPAVASDADGDFVVVWRSVGSSGSDTSSTSIQGQRYDVYGNALGGEFQVNAYTTYAQSFPAVASDMVGDFVVVWDSGGSSGSDTSSSSIQAQRYDASGNPLGGQFQVNAYTTSSQGRPAVAKDPDGNFVVVWQSYGSSGSDTSGYSIQAQRYDAFGNALGAQVQVNTYTTNGQRDPAVAKDPDGDFVIVWRSAGSSGSDASGYSIQAQLYDASGNALGGEFQVNAYTPNAQTFPAVATGPDGDFVVVWFSAGSSGSDTDGDSIQGRRYRVTGDVGDRVFFDRDFDGIQDGGETGLAGIPVHLFDSFSNLTRSTTTDPSGLYHFQPKPGQYYLQFELPSNQSFTPQDRGGDDSLDSDAEVLTGETDTFTVGLLSNDLDWDAGMSNGVGDRVWIDGDGNGAQDGGESGIAGVTVELFDELDALVDSTTTAADGRYTFASITPGVYYLRFTAPTGSTFTLQDASPDDRDSDVNPATSTTPAFTFAPGDLDVTLDAGIVTSVDVGDRVWLDDDGNGIQDGGEIGSSGVVVRLRDSGGSLVASDTTDSSGNYGFAAAPGSYYLEVVLPSGFAFAPRDQGASDGADSDTNPTTGTTILFTLGAGGPDLSWDTGLEPAVLGNLVWLDRNGNGLQDADEPGVSGIPVRLLDDGGTLLQTTTTDAQGRYAFVELPSGNYEIEFAPPPGWAFTAQGVGPDPLRDSDADVTTGRTGTISYSTASAARFLDAGLLEVPIFTDGFESGGTSAWSSATP